MGSSQSSETMIQNPVFQKITKTLYLLPFKQNNTLCLAHRLFAFEFARIEKAKFDRTMNPFCPLRIKENDKIITCCLISPILAIVHGQEIAKKGWNKGRFQNQCEIFPVYKRIEAKIEAEDAYVIGQGSIGLLFLESPYWKVGWGGVSYINSIEELQKLELKIVCHPDKILNKQQGKIVYIQQVKRLKIPKVSQLDSNFCSQVNGVPGSIVCKLVEKKPYIIGIQISETQLKFIDQQLFKSMQQICKQYVQKRGEKQILKEMDLEQFEIQIQL